MAKDDYEKLDLDMPAVRWEDVKEIAGTIIDTDVFESDNGPKRVFVVDLAGEPHRLIEQPGLRRLFEKCTVGDSIKVRTTGMRDLGEKQKMRTFEADIKKGPGAPSANKLAEADEQRRARPSRRGSR